MQETITLTIGAECLLQGAPPILLNVLKKELTLANPKYRDAKKYGRWIGKGLRPYLYFFKDDARGFHFPRGFANQAIKTCRGIAGEPRLIDLRQQQPETDLTFKGTLRPYQKQAVSAAAKHDFGVVESGTGSGKTVIALALIAGRRQPAFILVHTKELLYQWSAMIKTFLGIEAGLLGDGHSDLRPVTVGIVNTARRHLAELPKKFGQICVDECHRVPASLFTEVVKNFDCRYSLGLSATAYRRDGLTKLIYLYLGDLTCRIDPNTLRQTGAILCPAFIQRPTGFRYAYRDDYAAMMTALTQDDGRNRQIVNDIRQEILHGSGTILVVSDRIAHCERLAELLGGQGRHNGDKTAVAVLTGRVSTENRQAIITAIRQGRVKVVFSTVQLIGEGFDCPGLMTLFLTTPIKFSGRLLQVVGRVLRPAAGKQPKVYDYLDTEVGVLKSSAKARNRFFQEEYGQTGPNHAV